MPRCLKQFRVNTANELPTVLARPLVFTAGQVGTSATANLPTSCHGPPTVSRRRYLRSLFKACFRRVKF